MFKYDAVVLVSGARARFLSLYRYRCLRPCLCLSKASMGKIPTFPWNALTELSSVDQRTCRATSMWSKFSVPIDPKNKTGNLGGVT
jgi:hypothetical protein